MQRWTFTAVLLFPACWSWSTSLYVNNLSGSDENTGLTAETPFLSIRAALAGAQAGDVIQLRDTGTAYRETIRLSGDIGRPGQPLVIEGNGSVISGLKTIAMEQWQVQENGVCFFKAPTGGARRPYLVSGGQAVPTAREVAALAPGQAFWAKEGVYFMPEEGKTIGDYALEGTMLTSGVAIAGASHITVRTLTAEYFANDGFNVHGNCRGLLFENIEARFNGDDGFSVHEDVGAVVYGGYFHHNTFGIQDVNASRSVYNGVLVEHNRLVGVDFYGGLHSLVDSFVRDNGQDQIRVSASAARHMGFADDNPMCVGLAFVKNVVARGGATAFRVSGRARVTVTHSLFERADIGVAVGEGAVLHMLESAVLNCRQQELVCDSSEAWLDYNVYYPGRVAWCGQAFEPERFAAYQEAARQEANSVTIRPVFRASGSFVLAGPTLPRQDRQVLPGPTHGLELPNVLADTSNPEATEAAGGLGPDGYSYDFERENPWCRVYPVPTESKTGEAVEARSELSQEQAHSGTSSAKLQVTFPPGPPDAWLVKLFSVKFAYTRPVRSFSFWLFGTGTQCSFSPRVRDRDGEGFRGQRVAVDWQGWREIVWDLEQTPPLSIDHGNGNKLQDGPPLELVLDISVKLDADTREFVLYVDDLEVEFGVAAAEAR